MRCSRRCWTWGLQLRQKAVLFPCTDMAVLTLSRNREQLKQWYYVTLSAPDVVEKLMDKVGFYTYAQEAGLPIPATFFLKSRADVEQAAKQLSYPCILKPPMKTPTWEQNTKSKVFKLESSQELLETYDRCASWAELLMVQEWSRAPTPTCYSCNCYFSADSKPLVTFVAKKLRQWPPETGTSCLGEECRNDVVLHETLRLFESVGYRGLGYVEMKRDSAHRPSLYHRAKHRPPHRALGDQRGRRGRAGLYDVLRCAGITAADQPHAALHRREVDRYPARLPVGAVLLAAGRPVAARLGALLARPQGPRDLLVERPRAVLGRSHPRRGPLAGRREAEAAGPTLGPDRQSGDKVTW